jgi:hypothetical protein
MEQLSEFTTRVQLHFYIPFFFSPNRQILVAGVSGKCWGMNLLMFLGTKSCGGEVALFSLRQHDMGAIPSQSDKELPRRDFTQAECEYWATAAKHARQTLQEIDLKCRHQDLMYSAKMQEEVDEFWRKQDEALAKRNETCARV